MITNISLNLKKNGPLKVPWMLFNSCFSSFHLVRNMKMQEDDNINNNSSDIVVNFISCLVVMIWIDLPGVCLQNMYPSYLA